MRIETVDENGTGSQKATIKVFDDNDGLFTTIVGDITLKQGADGGYYHCVVFTEHPARTGT